MRRETGDGFPRRFAKVRCPVALLTIEQAAQRLSVSAATVYDLCARRKLPHVRIGTGRGTTRVDEQALEEFIKATDKAGVVKVVAVPAVDRYWLYLNDFAGGK